MPSKGRLFLLLKVVMILCGCRPSSLGPSEAAIPPPAEPAPSLVLTPRSNPRHLFVHHQLPSTNASPSVTTSPADAGKGKRQPEEEDQPGPSQQPGSPANGDHNGHHGRRQSSGRAERVIQEESEEYEQTGGQLSDSQVRTI